MFELGLDLQDLSGERVVAADEDVGPTVVKDEDVRLARVGGVEAACERAGEDGGQVGDEPFGVVVGQYADRMEGFQT